eukprot:scaffold161951_cov22-Prasinocladus_malaysianus.AAC.1
MASTALAYAVSEVHHEPLLEALAAEAIERVGELEPQALANTVYAYAALEIWHPELFDKIGR